MSTKKSFREQEYLRRAQEILAENEAAKAQAQTAIEQTPQQKAAAARNNAYMKALNAFVAQSNMKAPDPVKNRAGEVLAYAMQGDAQQQSTANALVSGAGTAPTRGDVKNWDWDAGRKAVLENETYLALMRNMGLYNTPDYATNSQYVYLVGNDYLKEQQGLLAGELEESRKKDKAANSWQNWSDMKNRIGEMTEYNAPFYWAYADYLLGNDTAPFNMDAYDTAWENMTDEEFYAEQERLRAQFAGLNLTELSTQPKDYTSQTAGLEEQLGVVQSEIDRRSKVAELETLARSNPNFDELSVYEYEGSIPGYQYGFYVPGAEYLHTENYNFGKDLTNQQTFVNIRAEDAVEQKATSFWETAEEYRSKGYGYLTSEEIAVYNVLYNTDQQKAQEYLDALQPTLYRRVADVERMGQTVYSQNGGWAVPMWLGSVGAGLENTFMAPLQFAAAAMGQDDPNAPEYYFLRTQQNIRNAQDQVLADIEALKGMELFGKNPAQLAYGGVSSAADNTARLLFGKTGSLLAAGAQSASGSLYENAGRADMSGAAKIVQALATGGLEIGTEKIGLDALFDMGQDNAVKYLVKAIGSELGEESINYVGEYGVELAVAWLFDHEAEVRSAPELLAGLGETALQTLISAGIMSGPGAVTTSRNTRTTGKTAQQQGDVDTLITIAEGMGENSEAGKWAARLKARKQKGGRVSNYDVGRLTMALEQEVSTEMAEAPNQVMDEAIEGRLVELGETAENAKALAPIVRKTYRGQKVSGKEIKAVSWSDNAEQVVKELSRDTTAEDAGRAGVDWAVQAKEGGVAAVEKATEKAATFAQAAGQRNKVVKGTQELQRVEGTLETSAAQAATKGTELAQNAGNKFKGGTPRKKAVSYVTDDSTGQGELLRFVSDGGTMKAVVAEEQAGETTEKTVGLDQIDAAADEGVGAILAYVQDDGNQHHQMSEQEANTMLQVYAEEGGKAEEFIRGYEAAYLAGYAGIEVPTTNLSTNAAEMAYKYGAQNAQADETNRSTRAGRQGTQGTGAVTWLGQVGSNGEVTGMGRDITSAMETMTESQRTTAEVVQALAQKLNIDVVLFESSADTMEGIQNGSFVPGTNRLYIDVNSGAANAQSLTEQKANGTLGYAMMKTLGHELTHYMESNSAEQYATYKQAVKNGLKAAGQDWATLVREKIDNAIRAGHKLTLAGAEAEVVADASEYMLQNSAFVQGLDNSVRGKVKQFIQSFMEKVRSIFANLTGGHRESEALRKTIDGVMQYTGNLQRLWDAGLRDATGRNYAENTTMRPSTTVQAAAEQNTSQTEEAVEEWTPAEEIDEEIWTPEDDVQSTDEQLAEEIYEEPAKAVTEERTVQDVIEEPTVRELKQEAKATQKIAPQELIQGIADRFGIDIRVVDRANLLASYNPDSGVILIGKNASTGEVLYKALSMELMRHAQNSQYAKQLQTAVGQVAYAGNSDGYFKDLRTVADEMNQRFDNYGKRKLTAESPIVQAELFARMAAKVFGNESSMITLIEQNFQKPTLLQRIRNALKGFVNKLRGLKTPALTPVQRAEHLLGLALKDAQKAAANPDKGAQLLDNFTDTHVDAANRQTLMAYTTVAGEKVALEVDGDRGEVQYSSRDKSQNYASVEDEDFHRDGRIYDYDFMVAQMPISVVTIPSVNSLMNNGRFSRSDVVEKGKGNIQGPANEMGHKSVTNVYTGRRLTITNNSIRHGLNGPKQRLLANAQIGLVIGDVVENGIPVNGLSPADNNALQTYAMVTPCITEDGKQMMAVTHVDIQKNEVNSVTFTDIVHSANGRIYKNSEPVSDTIDVEGESPYHPSRYTISISDLLKDVNMSFKSLLSKDVLKNLGEEKTENGVYSDKVLYSTRDTAPETTVREYLADADDSMAVTVEERNALQIYQDRLQAHAEATQAVLDAEYAMKGKDGEELKDARAALARARAAQREQYDLLLKLEGTENVQSVMQRTQQFITEEIAGKTSEEIAGMISEREQQIRQLEQDLEGLKGAARAQQEADIRDNKRVVRALKNKATYKLEKRTEEFRAREQKAREYRRTRDEVNKLRRSIGRSIKRLNTLRVRETDQKHVPQELQHVADMVMQTFTDSSLARLAFSQKKAASLSSAYAKLLQQDTDEEIEQDIKELAEQSKAYNALANKQDSAPSYFSLEGVKMEREILTSVQNIVDHVLKLIDDTNKAFMDGRQDTFKEYATKTVEALEKKKDHKRIAFGVGKKLETLSGAVNYGNKTPIYFFRELGIPQLEELGQKLFDAEHEYGIRYAEADAKLRHILGKYNYWAWDRNKTVTFKTKQAITQEMLENGKGENAAKHVVTMDLGTAMAVYATWKREHHPDSLVQTRHLDKGGFVKKGIIKEGIFEKKDETPHLLAEADFAYIDDMLTKDQKAFVDEVVQFITEYGDIYGNKTSMKIFGYKKFNDRYYFPISTQRNQLKKNSDAATRPSEDGRIKNMKSSKKRVSQASTPVEIGDFLETVQDHMQQMILYSTFAEPIEDLNRVMNYAYEDATGSRKTVRGLIEQKYGKNAVDYIDKLTADLNGGVKTDKAETFFAKMFSMFKKSRVVASLSVALQQPTSIIRAMMEVNPKYFVPLTGKANVNLLQEYEQLEKHSGVAVLKKMGGFDMTNTYSMARNLGGTEMDGYSIFKKMRTAFLAGGQKGIQEKTQAASEQWNKAFGWLASKADRIAWIVMWRAIKNETHAKYPNLDVNSEEFLDIAGKRFNEVMRLTQVYDSTMARSQNMRSNTMGMKMITSFAAEPTLTANMLQGALKSKNGKKIARAIAVYYASQIITAAAAAIIKAGRDDDESKTYAEKFLASMGNALGGYSGGLNPLAQIPGVRDLLSLLDGYDLERGDMSIFADITDELDKLAAGKYEDDPQKGLEKAGGAIANLFGIPLENIMRDVRSIWNSVRGLANPPRATNPGVLLNDAKENFALRLIFEPETSVKSYYAKLSEALVEDDMEEVDDLTAYLGAIGKDADAIIEGVRDAYKARYEEGGIAQEEAVQFLLDNDLVKGDTPEKRRMKAFEYVDKWEEGEAGGGVYVSIKAAVHRNDMTTVDQEIEELLSYGWTAKDVFGEMHSEVKKAYMAGEISKDAYKQFYNKHGIAAGQKAKDENGWYWMFKELDWGKAHGGDLEGYDMHADLWTAVESGSNLRATINDYQSHGRTREQLNDALNDHYKPILIDLYQTNRAEFTRVQARVLTAYAQLGYDFEQKRKLIEGWVK